MPMLNQLLTFHRLLQPRTIPKTPQRLQQLRNTIISKDSEFIDVVELAIVLAIKARPHVCDKNLSTLEDTNGLAVLELHDVVEAGEVGGEEVDERSGRPIGAGNAVYETAVVFLKSVLMMFEPHQR